MGMVFGCILILYKKVFINKKKIKNKNMHYFITDKYHFQYIHYLN